MSRYKTEKDLNPAGFCNLQDCVFIESDNNTFIIKPPGRGKEYALQAMPLSVAPRFC